MKDEDIEGIADAINEFVHDSVEPLSKGLSEVVKRVDEIHARPIPENGRDGVDGKDGADGQDGEKGDTGEKGVDGVGLDAPVYESGVYREGSIVQAHFGQVYKAVRDTSEGVDSEDWERVGTAGFRLTGTFDAEKEYVAGDLFIKGFGLFLHDGAEARLIAGRGPEGKKGERGAAGKDGKDGQDGKDGATFDALEIKGTNLVAVIRSAEGLQEHAVDLAPFLEATVEVTKSVSEAHTEEAIKALDNQFKSLWETFQQHLTDQQATPVRFFRGGYTPSVTYQAGDLVNFSQSLYVAKQASTGILPHGQLAKDVKSGDYWAMLTSGGGGGVIDGENLSPVLPTYALVTESGAGGTKFRNFSQANGTDPIVGVGLQNGQNVKFDLTTDAVAVNPNPFRNAKGQFAATPEELENLKNQRDVNEFLYEQIQKVEGGEINLDGYATEEWVTEQIDAIPETDLTGYVSKDGDVMTGPLETPSIKTGVIEPEKWWGIDLIGALNVDNDDKPAVSIMKNGYSQMELSAVGSVSLWNGYTDFKDNELVTKEYVDGRVDEVADALPNNAGQPVDIGTQILEVLGSRPTGSGGKAGFMQVWKAEAGGPGSPFNEAKFIVPDTSVIDNTATQLWLKQGNIVQRWENGGGGWFTNNNVYHVSGNVTEGDDLIDGQPVELYYSDPASSFLDVISKEESKADDQALQAQIDALDIPDHVDPDSFVSKTGGDDMEGPLDVRSQPDTGSRDTSRVNTLGVYSNSSSSYLGLGTSGTKVYVGHSDTSFATPIKVAEIQEKNDGGGIAVTGQVTLGSEGTEAGHAVTKGYVDSADRRLQAEVEELALGLETLLTQRTHGQWKYVGFSGDNIPRNEGEFALASDDLSSQDNILTVNLTDLNGMTIGLSDVEVGDYIEIVDLDKPANYVLFTCTKAPEGTGISNIEVALKDKGNNFLVGDTCEIRFFSVNEENVNLSELDDRYAFKGHVHSDYFPIGDWSDSEHEPYPDLRAMDDSYAQLYEASQKAQQIVDAAQNRRLDDLEASSSDFVSKSGDEIAGQLIIKKDKEVALDIMGDGGQSQIKFWSSGAVAIQNYTAFKDNELVTKKYVDDAVSTTDAKVKGALLTHTQRLVHVSNGTDGSQFYFWDENNMPTDAMNNFRRFKWKLPSSHYLMGMVGAGENMGYLVIQNTGGSLLYQCQVSRAVKSSNSGYIDLYLDHATHYGSSQLAFGGIFVVSMYSCLREA